MKGRCTTPTLLLVQLLFSLSALLALILARPQNYEALLQNRSFVESQIKCVLNRGSCDRIGTRIRELAPETIQTGSCISCNREEQVNVQKVLEHVQKKYPKKWAEIEKLYGESKRASKLSNR